MTRSELISRLAAHNQTLSNKDAEVSVSVIIDSLAAALSRGDRIEIRRFGSFMLGYRPPRTGRNPKANVQVAVPAKYTPRFRAGKDLRQRVDQAVHAADHASGGDGSA